MPCHWPDGRDIEDGDAHADQNGDVKKPPIAQQCLRYSQGNVGVKPKTNLRAGRMVTAVNVASDDGPVGDAVRDADTAHCKRHTREHEVRGGRDVQGVARDAVKQQDGKEKEVHQRVNLPPNAAI